MSKASYEQIRKKIYEIHSFTSEEQQREIHQEIIRICDENIKELSDRKSK